MAGDERRDNFATREDMEQINEKLDSLEAMCFDIQSAPRQKPVKDLLPWLPFVLSIISLIVFIVTMNMTIQQLRVDQNSISTRLDSFIEKQEAINKARDSQMTDISVKLAEIQKDIVYIRSSLDNKSTASK